MRMCVYVRKTEYEKNVNMCVCMRVCVGVRGCVCERGREKESIKKDIERILYGMNSGY